MINAQLILLYQHKMTSTLADFFILMNLGHEESYRFIFNYKAGW